MSVQVDEGGLSERGEMKGKFRRTVRSGSRLEMEFSCFLAFPEICTIAVGLFRESPTLQNEIVAVQNIAASLNQANFDEAFPDGGLEEGVSCFTR